MTYNKDKCTCLYYKSNLLAKILQHTGVSVHQYKCTPYYFSKEIWIFFLIK